MILQAPPQAGKLALTVGNVTVTFESMHTIIPIRKLALLWVLTVAWLGSPAVAAPRHVYLTWQDDPARAITVNYHTISSSSSSVATGSTVSQVLFDTVARGGMPSTYGGRAVGTRQAIAAVPGRSVHRVQLTGLLPERSYWFVAGDSLTGFSSERAFRTAPDGEEPLRFVAAGDMGVAEGSRRLQAVAADQEPLFALLGGDLAYTDGDWDQWPVWDRWLDNWQELMVTPAGYTVPIVSAIGHHEVSGGYGGAPDNAPIYLSYLAQAGDRSYYLRQVGSRLVIFLLDSGHLASHGGAQAQWLEQQMAAHAGVPVRLATYHVPLFPGFRLPSTKYSKTGRRSWQPVFDRYGLTAAFENHDHVFKRTHPIRGDHIDPRGTLYLGDGSFGRGPRMTRGPRQVHLRRRWYLDRLESKGHIWRVDVAGDSVVFAAVDQRGRVFDRTARRSPGRPTRTSGLYIWLP